MNRVSKNSTSRQLERELPKYRILALVGWGQFGQVFCAVERQTGQLVALKQIAHRRLSTSKFLRELASLLTLQHPNIVTCRSFQETSTARYLVMDYCEGGTLRGLLEQENSLNLGEALKLMQGILAGLEQAHRQGIIHCDIKPENILLESKEGMWLPRLSDFGIARRLSDLREGEMAKSADGTIEVVGSPAYTSPETYYGMYSRSSDIYAMGIVLFELLLGYRPFSGTPERLMWAHLNQPLEIPSVVPEPLQVILKKSLAKLKGRRYQTARDMSEAIAHSLNDPNIKDFIATALPFKGDRTTNPEQSPPLLPFKGDRTSNPEQSPPLARGGWGGSASPFDLQVPDICTIAQQELPAAVTSLFSGHGYLYGTLEKKTLLTWPPSQTQPVSVSFAEPIYEIVPVGSCCLVRTGDRDRENAGSIYWLSPKNPQPQCLLKFPHPFTLAADPSGQWFVVAVLSQQEKKTLELRFYSLKSDRSLRTLPEIKLLRNLSMSVGQLPQLMFLDKRHVLAVWRSRKPKKLQTIFKVYSRRGTEIGSLRSPVLFDRLICTDSPGILFGLARQHRPALWRINLMPLQLMRIPLESIPTCFAPVPGGCVLANSQGQITLWDLQGQNNGQFQFGFQAPLGLAAWTGYREVVAENLVGLAGVTDAAKGSCIFFIQLRTAANSPIQP